MSTTIKPVSLDSSVGEKIAVALAEKGYEAINYANPFVCQTDAYIMGNYKFPQQCPVKVLQYFNSITMREFSDNGEMLGQVRYYLIGVLLEQLLSRKSENDIFKKLDSTIADITKAIRKCDRKPDMIGSEEPDLNSPFIYENRHGRDLPH